MKTSQKYLYFFLVFFPLSLCSKISIVSPKWLVQRFNEENDNQISCKVLHFGNVQNDTQLTGTILATCKTDGCDPLSPLAQDNSSDIHNSIVIANMGRCNITTKAKNAQLAGANALILIDQGDLNWDSQVKYENESGDEEIIIPIIMVSRFNGEILWEFLSPPITAVPVSGIEVKGQNVTLNIDFSSLSTDPIKIDFWYNVGMNFDETINFFSSFNYYYSKYRGDMQFIPHYFTFACSQCKGTYWEPSDCLCRGLYCSPAPEYKPRLYPDGSEAVKEGIRQMCAYHISEGSWWRYALNLGCFKRSQCNHKGGLTQLDNELINNCFANSFEERNHRWIDNFILRPQKEAQEKVFIHKLPAIFINDQPYNGPIDSTSVFAEICKILNWQIPECSSAVEVVNNLNVEDPNDRIQPTLTVIAVMLVLSLLYCAIKARKEGKSLPDKIKDVVRDIFLLEVKVGQHIELEETGSIQNSP